MNFAPRVETTLLRRISKRSMSAVGVPTSPGKWSRLPPGMARVLFFSFFCSRIDLTNLRYVTSLNLSAGTCCLLIKKHVLVGLRVRPPIPWKSLPNLFINNLVHASLNFGSCMSCR